MVMLGLEAKRLYLYVPRNAAYWAISDWFCKRDQDFTGSWRLMPVLASPISTTEQTKALILLVDSPSWATLGHCIHYLTAVVYAISAWLSPRVARESLQLYLHFSNASEAEQEPASLVHDAKIHAKPC